jgi:hypothetical protein
MADSKPPGHTPEATVGTALTQHDTTPDRIVNIPPHMGGTLRFVRVALSAAFKIVLDNSTSNTYYILYSLTVLLIRKYLRQLLFGLPGGETHVLNDAG